MPAFRFRKINVVFLPGLTLEEETFWMELATSKILPLSTSLRIWAIGMSSRCCYRMERKRRPKTVMAGPRFISHHSGITQLRLLKGCLFMDLRLTPGKRLVQLHYTLP